MAIMRSVLPENLISLARVSPAPLYVVGGAVRDFAAGLSPSKRDWDICAPCSVSDMSRAAADCGFGISFSNAATGSLKLKRGDTVCEFTSFRTDVYGGKGHAPSAVKFTADIAADARRRDFTCNAVYYDICGWQFADPLGGLRDIAAGRLVPCAPADRLFAEDALRVLRLARFCGELGFDADDDCFAAAASAADGLRFLSPATVWREVCGIVRADEKYNMAGGAARALSVGRPSFELCHHLDVLPRLNAVPPERARVEIVAHSHTQLLGQVPQIQPAELIEQRTALARPVAFDSHDVLLSAIILRAVASLGSKITATPCTPTPNPPGAMRERRVTSRMRRSQHPITTPHAQVARQLSRMRRASRCV